MIPECEPPFWETKTLEQLTPEEWEALCDGCGKCCLIKLQDEETDEVFPTNVACRLLDLGSCQCSNYAERKRHVPDCVILDAETVPDLGWMPSTCAYRLIWEGKGLAWWHPLVSGDPETVHLAGISVRNRVVREDRVTEEDLPDHIVEWAR
ncbi:MAG: YcgN family cysteine cluster protein [Deinococcus-Thermus bacterium]|jgi:uncharacterized cysteine cluster protein YcgN (CxxCxxCC family)|nr:YcgN family cysteine cluster protein [Deinococcota bacterium]